MTIGVILSGGTGTRLGGDIPKQYLQVGGKYVIEYCLDTFLNSDCVDKLVIVAGSEWHELIKGCISDVYGDKFVGFAVPGENRQMSIYNALVEIERFADAGDTVIIHDAARPFVREETLIDLVEATKTADGAIPMLPMKDTVYMVRDGKIASLLEREAVMAGQAPEAFVFGKYLEANRSLLPEKILEIKGSTEVAFIAGMKVACIPGDEGNVKITTAEDLRQWQSRL